MAKKKISKIRQQNIDKLAKISKKANAKLLALEKVYTKKELIDLSQAYRYAERATDTSDRKTRFSKATKSKTTQQIKKEIKQIENFLAMKNNTPSQIIKSDIKRTTTLLLNMANDDEMRKARGGEDPSSDPKKARVQQKRTYEYFKNKASNMNFALVWVRWQEVKDLLYSPSSNTPVELVETGEGTNKNSYLLQLYVEGKVDKKEISDIVSNNFSYEDLREMFEEEEADDGEIEIL